MEDISSSVPSNDFDAVISPEPVSYLFPMAVVEPEERAELPNPMHSVERRERGLSTSNVEKTWRASFKILQCHGILNTYILEMHNETESASGSAYQLVVHEKEVQVKVLSDTKNITISANVHIVNPLHVRPRSQLSFRERLGRWTVEQRKHNNSERRDKFYVHEKVPKKFRSLQEVATFILYNCYREDLKNPPNIEI